MKIIVATMMTLVLAISSVTVAYADSTSSIKSIDTVLSEIRAELALKATDPINPDKVSNALLEQLGDSVMEAMIGNHALHEQMDARMGGDGSATLTAMHIRMGYGYLYRILYGSNIGYGPVANGYWAPMMGYSGWGMMNGLTGKSMMYSAGWRTPYGFAGNGMMYYSGRSMMNGYKYSGMTGFHNNWNYMMGNQNWNTNVVPNSTQIATQTPNQTKPVTPVISKVTNPTTPNSSVTQNWNSQTTCANNVGLTPGSTNPQTTNNNYPTNSGNWNNMNWDGSGMMN